MLAVVKEKSLQRIEKEKKNQIVISLELPTQAVLNHQNLDRDVNSIVDRTRRCRAKMPPEEPVTPLRVLT